MVDIEPVEGDADREVSLEEISVRDWRMEASSSLTRVDCSERM